MNLSLIINRCRSFLLSGVMPALVLSGMMQPVQAYTLSGIFAPTGSTITARQNFTSTLLPNGKVLITGGAMGAAATANSMTLAELYDPATGLFTTASSMVAARKYHTATLLPNGKVLIVGGLSGSVPLSSAELYDPVTGLFTLTGSMASGRSNHTATLLPNGKVLIAGGTTGTFSTAALYDPATGLFTATGAAIAERSQHTATLLPNGKVLIAGGRDVVNYLSSAMLYDPATGTYAVTGSMNTTRGLHTASLLLNGKVLIAGGWSGSGLALSSTEQYDPATGMFTATGSMVEARYFHTATLLPRGEVLLVGGIGAGTVYSITAELYDPATGIFTLTGAMPSAHSNHAVVLLPGGNKVLVVGGLKSKTALTSTAELYNYDYYAPDLVATTMSLNPASPRVGDLVTFSVTVLNQGNVNAGAFEVDLYQGLAGAPVAGQAGNVSCTIANLAAGANTTCTGTILYTAAGNYSLWAQVDTLNQVAELDETNDVLGPMTLTVTNPPADLVIDSLVSVPVNPKVGDVVTITATVRNAGGSAANGFSVDIYKHLAVAPGVGQAGDITCPMLNLAPGASTTCSGTITYAVAGGYSLWAQADSANAVVEASEANNIAGPAALTVAALPVVIPPVTVVTPVVTVVSNPPAVSSNPNICKGKFRDEHRRRGVSSRLCKPHSSDDREKKDKEDKNDHASSRKAVADSPAKKGEKAPYKGKKPQLSRKFS